MTRYFLGIDLGSSSIKASILDADTGEVVGSAASPATEMAIVSPQEHWAEQDPELWWENTVAAVSTALSQKKEVKNSIAAIGISYQMHGLVLVDKDQRVLRPSIIWCDSRAVEIGDRAYKDLGETYCMERLLNSPGNFTASKLKWVMDNEPSVYARIHKAMLPGDYLAMRLCGEISTTVSGLSEWAMWDFGDEEVSGRLADYYGLERSLLAKVVPTFSVQGTLTRQAAASLGLKEGIPISYRAGDQPNNALSLNTLHPGEVAATAGTSGVIYTVVNKPIADRFARVNTFVHVNHTQSSPRYGILMCVNGTGSMNSWLRNLLSSMGKGQIPYAQMDNLAAEASIGSDGLIILPFGNGAERILGNKELGASVHGLDFNKHNASHLCRAMQEGIVFALAYGFEILHDLNLKPSVIRAGNANMFKSNLFCEMFAQVTGTRLELYNTDGSQGAARGAGVGLGHYKTPQEAFAKLRKIKDYQPVSSLRDQYLEKLDGWKSILRNSIIHYGVQD